MSREDWQPSAYDKYPAIDMSSSYFAKTRHCSPTEFSELINPRGELALRATAQNLVRHPDFLEEFCERKIIESNDKIWKTIIIPSAIVIIRRDIDRAYMKWRLEDTTLHCTRTPLVAQRKREREYISNEEISVGKDEQRQAKQKEMDGETVMQDQLC
ncbi:hypothetical protein M422DRAFT_260721 [Sphaerobolus stellatus SS14]|uniref:Uncharacterized protein n=1 Tax=Sphaerobolus stellatus (strain SS14) TaxID=990650 RepID=A0A0C9UQ82_SPHS4|nr:hypothetical protein M422DRAFT_260721 [Sphaerobolus stellatus SS14]